MMGISFWSWFKQHIDQKCLNWWDRSSEYVCFIYMWITASNLISDSLFSQPHPFSLLKEYLTPAVSFQLLLSVFLELFWNPPRMQDSWPLDSGSSVTPGFRIFCDPHWDNGEFAEFARTSLSLSLFFFSNGGKLISFLPGVTVVDLIYSCWETVMVLIKLRVSHWFGSAHCGEELLRDLFRDWWANKGSGELTVTRRQTHWAFLNVCGTPARP